MGRLTGLLTARPLIGRRLFLVMLTRTDDDDNAQDEKQRLTG